MFPQFCHGAAVADLDARDGNLIGGCIFPQCRYSPSPISTVSSLLLCFLLGILCEAAITLSVAQAETGNILKNSAWTIARETDPILDTTNITAQLRETGGKRSLLDTGKFLVLRCRERQLDTMIVWGTFGELGFSSDSGVNVIIRFDALTPVTERWSRSTDYNATFSPHPSQFVRTLTQHQKLAARTRPADGGFLTAVFDLSEAIPVVQEVKAACGQ